MATQNKLEIVAEPGGQNITLTREINAPVDRVFAAHTDAELVTKWLGPRRLEMKVDQWQATTGGSYAYTHIDEDGSEHRFRGTFHTVEQGQRIIQTFEYLGFPGQVSLEAMSFTDLGAGRCLISSTSTYPSNEVREQMLQSGMETGLIESYERLEELVS